MLLSLCVCVLHSPADVHLPFPVSSRVSSCQRARERGSPRSVHTHTSFSGLDTVWGSRSWNTPLIPQFHFFTPAVVHFSCSPPPPRSLVVMVTAEALSHLANTEWFTLRSADWLILTCYIARVRVCMCVACAVTVVFWALTQSQCVLFLCSVAVIRSAPFPLRYHSC